MAAADQTIARKDEPLVRRLRRGTTTDALAALEEKGATALVDVLLKDRYAKGTAEANASLVRTWHQFHDEAFRHAHPPVPTAHHAQSGHDWLALQGWWLSFLPELRLHNENEAH